MRPGITMYSEIHSINFRQFTLSLQPFIHEHLDAVLQIFPPTKKQRFT